jgi:hypothetical protein
MKKRLTILAYILSLAACLLAFGGCVIGSSNDEDTYIGTSSDTEYSLPYDTGSSSTPAIEPAETATAAQDISANAINGSALKF